MKSRCYAVATVVAGLFIQPPLLSAQDSTETQRGTLRVFLDCCFCDSRHFRREVPFVNYVNDRQVADIHVLGTTQRTGAGREYNFEFIGLRQLAGQADTLRYRASATNTSDETREGQTRLFALGLIPFVTETPSHSSSAYCTSNRKKSNSGESSGPRKTPGTSGCFAYRQTAG